MNYFEAREIFCRSEEISALRSLGWSVMFTEFEDANWHILCFNEDMRDTGIDSTVNYEDDMVPRKPSGGYWCRNVDPAYPDPPQLNDEDRISKYTSARGRHNKRNACTVGCFLATCDTTVCQEIGHMSNIWEPRLVKTFRTLSNTNTIIRPMASIEGKPELDCDTRDSEVHGS